MSPLEFGLVGKTQGGASGNVPVYHGPTRQKRGGSLGYGGVYGFGSGGDEDEPTNEARDYADYGNYDYGGRGGGDEDGESHHEEEGEGGGHHGGGFRGGE